MSTITDMKDKLLLLLTISMIIVDMQIITILHVKFMAITEKVDMEQEIDIHLMHHIETIIEIEEGVTDTVGEVEGMATTIIILIIEKTITMKIVTPIIILEVISSMIVYVTSIHPKGLEVVIEAQHIEIESKNQVTGKFHQRTRRVEVQRNLAEKRGRIAEIVLQA